MRVVVDFDRCESNAICMGIAPEVFEVRSDDFLYVLQDEPPEVKGRSDTKGEASLRGHLKVQEGEEQTGSQSWYPADNPKDDKALNMALELLRGTTWIRERELEQTERRAGQQLREPRAGLLAET